MAQSEAHSATKQGPGATLVEVVPDEAGQRVDNFLLRRLKGVPRTRIYRMLRKGEVRVNKGRVRPSHRLEAGDQVRLPPVRTGQAATPQVPGRLVQQLQEAILYEDEALLVVDKPAGLAVHGGSGLAFGLIEALRQLRDEPDLELAHRLDRGTSGCLLVARDRQTVRALHRMLRDDQVEKRYLTLLAGPWPGGARTVEAPLARVREGAAEQYAAVVSSGKPAKTQFAPVRRYRDAALVEARLLTGRMHQIRAHAAYIGHPVAGDGRYGDRAFNERLRQRGLKRLFLHAAGIRLLWPGRSEPVDVTAPLPTALQQILQQLGDEGE